MLKRRLREPFGKAGLTVAILALVLAMVGGAYAAGGLTSQQEKQVKKIAKKFAGKPGAAGTNGANGASGAPGAKGENGAAGAKGENGVSVTTVAIPKTPSKCSNQGGVEVKSASAPLNVCNGQTGFTETLPPGQTETGTVIFEGTETAALSFPIPLETTAVAHFVKSGETAPAGCVGGSFPAPSAELGNLCVFQNENAGVGVIEAARFSAVKPAGTFLELEFEAGEALAEASFAVTAPE